MKHLHDTIFGLFGLLCGWTLLALSPHSALAQMEKYDTQQASSASGTTSGAPDKAEPGEIKERGILRQFPPVTAQPGTIAPPTVDEEFKCSVHSQKCTCGGQTDCNLMKKTLPCKPTCTGTGAKQKCCCVLAGGTGIC
jgi:hypothetical protein